MTPHPPGSARSCLQSRDSPAAAGLGPGPGAHPPAGVCPTAFWVAARPSPRLPAGPLVRAWGAPWEYTPALLTPGNDSHPHLTDPRTLPGLGKCVGSCTPSPSQAFALAFWQHPGGATLTNETGANSCLLQEEYLALLRREEQECHGKQ